MPDLTRSEIETLLDEQDPDTRRFEVLTTLWSAANDDSFCWSINDCRNCEKVLKEGERGYVFAEPFSADSKYVALVALCSEDCVDEAVGAFTKQHEIDRYYTIISAL